MLRMNQRNMLAAPIKTSEIDIALRGIHPESAPGIDGLTSLFYKEIWDFVKDDIYRAIFHLFESNKLYAPVNTTSITLIPKSLHANSISQYRPFSCCNVLYKIVSKVLANRLQNVIMDIVDPSQSGFIPRR